MRIALAFFGVTRNVLDVTVESINENILLPLKQSGYECDIYLHTYKIKGTDWSKLGNEKVELNPDEYKILNPDYFLFDERDEVLDKLEAEQYASGNGFKERNKRNNNILKLFSIQRVTDMILKESNGYDYIFYLRPDVKYIDKFNPSWLNELEKNPLSFLSPNFHLWEGINDRMFVAKYPLSLIYGSFLNKLKDYCDQKRKLNQKFYLCEDLIFDKSIEIGATPILIPFRFCRVRANKKIEAECPWVFEIDGKSPPCRHPSKCCDHQHLLPNVKVF